MGLTLARNTSLYVRSAVASGPFYINLNIPVTFPGALGSVIDGVAVCFFSPNPRTFIDETRIGQLQFSGEVLTRHLDSTDRVSGCYFSPVADVAPGGAMFLVLGLRFGNVADEVRIDAVAVSFK